MEIIKNITILLTFFASILIVSCSSDSEDNNNILLSPPSWTHGTWKDEVGLYTAKFTSNNLIFESGGTSLNFSEVANSTQGISIAELINTDSEYKVKFAGTTYHFRKKSDSQIAFVLADDSELPAEWILNKFE